MNYLRQEKSLRDHESSLKGFAVIAGRGNARGENIFGELPSLSSKVGLG
jgi:hypothetical protein